MIEYYKDKSLENLFYIDMNGIKQEEGWFDVIKGVYQISEIGRLKSLDRITIYSNGNKRKEKGRILSQSFDKDGYLQSSMTQKGKSIGARVHRLVGLAFIPNPENKLEINHKKNSDEIVNKRDNRYWMLEWNTNAENIANSWKDGLQRITKGTERYNSKFTDEQILEVRELAKTMLRKDIAIMFNVKNSCISNIVLRRTWKHIP